MNTKKISVAVTGEELSQHIRLVRLEVPIDATDDELETITSDMLLNLGEDTWECEDSDGVCENDDPIYFDSDLDDNEQVHGRLIRNSSGELELEESPLEVSS